METVVNITFEICFKLRSENITFSQEYTAYYWGATSSCRFDLVILKEKIVKGIIVVKLSSASKKKTKLIEKYEKFGVPIFLCYGENDIENTINFAKFCISTPIESKILMIPGNIPNMTRKVNNVKKMPDETLVSAKKLYSAGLNSREIAKALKITRSMVRPYIKIWNIEGNNRKQWLI